MSMATKQKQESGFSETVRVIFHALLIALIIRTFLFQPFNIPSGSMKDTLLVGDYLFVSKFSYGYSRFSIPFSPNLFSGRIWDGSPTRGDVAVFKLPKDNSTDYIKRVVGLPGDLVEYRGKVLYINGEEIAQVPVGTYIGTGSGLSASGASLRLEQLGEVSHQILVEGRRPVLDGEFRVPEGHYFVMGDNRDNSNDSRFWGTVPEQNLVGRAFLIWMNWDSAGDGVSWGRIGDGIQ